MQRRKPLTRKTGLNRTPIRRVSAKLSKELKRYYLLRDEFLNTNRTCEVGWDCNYDRAATEVHHSKGRGPFLNVVPYFVATCRSCHTKIHENAKEARKRGWLLT